jgi:hypothetical protein
VAGTERVKASVWKGVTKKREKFGTGLEHAKEEKVKTLE